MYKIMPYKIEMNSNVTKKIRPMHIDSIFFPPKFTLLCEERYCAPVWGQLDFRINWRDKRRAGAEMGNATPQLGAN